MTERPFQPLFARLAEAPAEETPHEGVPTWLTAPLREWLTELVRLSNFIDTDKRWAQRAVVQLRSAKHESDEDYTDRLIGNTGDDLLSATDAALQLNPCWDLRRAEAYSREEAYKHERIDELFTEHLWALRATVNRLI